VVDVLRKVHEGSPHVVDAIRAGEIALVINTPAGAESVRDAFPIRRAALECGVPYFTTLAAAAAAADGIEHLQAGTFSVRPLQSYHGRAAEVVAPR
jgi:carbamoyl-phosphate synthase large subunit